jgi:hypothetical protein
MALQRDFDSQDTPQFVARSLIVSLFEYMKLGDRIVIEKFDGRVQVKVSRVTTRAETTEWMTYE